MERFPHYDVDRIEGVLVVFFADVKVINRESIIDIQTSLIKYVERTKPETLILHFGKIAAMSSEFLSALLLIREKVIAHGGALKLSNMSAVVRSVFRLTNLEGRVFQIYDSMPQALDAFTEENVQ